MKSKTIGIVILLLFIGCTKGVIPNFSILKPYVSSWMFVDGGSSDGTSGFPAITGASEVAMGSINNLLYLITAAPVAQFGLNTTVYNGQDSSPSWNTISQNYSNQPAAGLAVNYSTVTNDSKLYLIWQENKTGAINNGVAQLHAAVNTGNFTNPWQTVDILGRDCGNSISCLNFNPANPVGVNGTVSFNNQIFIIWSESSGVNQQIFASVYNGNDSNPNWSFVINGGANPLNYNTANSASTPQLASLNSKLYAIWQEDDDSPLILNIRVAVYNGLNGASAQWNFVDGNGIGGINHNQSNSASSPAIFNYNGKLYATWAENTSGTSGISQIRVAVYNGEDASPGWSFLDGGGSTGVNYDSTKNANGPSNFISFYNVLYLTWLEENPSGILEVRIAVYNGNDSSPTWSFVDGALPNGLHFSPTAPCSSPFLYTFNGNIYSTWTEFVGPQEFLIRAAVGR